MTTTPERPPTQESDLVDDPKTTTGMAPDRRAKFEADIAQIRVRTSDAGSESRLIAAGAGATILGIVIAIVAYATSTSQADSREVISSVILGVVGLCLVVGGAALFLRYSISRFMRVWLLRLIYEQQAPGTDA